MLTQLRWDTTHITQKAITKLTMTFAACHTDDSKTSLVKSLISCDAYMHQGFAALFPCVTYCLHFPIFSVLFHAILDKDSQHISLSQVRNICHEKWISVCDVSASFLWDRTTYIVDGGDTGSQHINSVIHKIHLDTWQINLFTEHNRDLNQ